jgi:Protein of unknown function (DUF2380)
VLGLMNRSGLPAWAINWQRGRFSLVDITPIASEAQASNLQACGGCDIQLARRIGAELAITGTVHAHAAMVAPDEASRT